ncbi:MAG: hypothetical protein IJQ97_04035 [Paludibacteraceae bacterium]|nr:hypothetical protein [Paludibacteraceae bacterium]
MDWQLYWDKKRETGEARPVQTVSHRARKSWNDYSGLGIYHITIVTHNRQRVFGELNRDLGHPQVILTKFGQFVAEQWLKIPDIQSEKGRKVSVLGHQVMPDHFHGVLRVEEPMDVSMGVIIRGFKGACTKQYRRMYQPNLADLLEHPDTQARLERMSHRQREEYYASIGAEPLFDDNYDDTICYRNGQLTHIIRYVQDNPRRAILRAMQPDFFKRIQHITIDGVDFAAYGNIFLLRRPWKEQVFCHRWRMDGDRRDYSTPYETTDEYNSQRAAWLDAAIDGAVLVTPGVSKGEQQLVKDCLEQELLLIHLQADPIGPNWHPEYRRYELCAAGKLLILSPWQLDERGDVNGVPAATDYSRFHNLNELAELLCREPAPMMNIKR